MPFVALTTINLTVLGAKLRISIYY